MSRIERGTVLQTETGATVAVRAWRGEGSYARVYRATHAACGECALKVAKPEIPGAAERLRQERAVLAMVRDPRIVRLLDAGEAAGAPFLALEWLEGETLRDDVARRRRLPLRDALAHFEAICSGLAALHRLGLAHGDLRPENVVIVRGRGAILTDPGAGAGATFSSGAADLRAAAALFHWMLTGTAEGETPRLTAAAGYNPDAVRLWESARSPSPPSAAELRARAERLRRSL